MYFGRHRSQCIVKRVNCTDGRSAKIQRVGISKPRRSQRDWRVSTVCVRTGGTLTYEADGSTDYAAWYPLEEVGSLDRVSLVDVGRRLAGLI